MPNFEIGAHREEKCAVGNDNAITFLGPEGPRVLSTPHMIGLMERTCRNLVLGMLDAGQDTVGTHVDVYHRAAAAMGNEVAFHAEITSVDKQRVNFAVKALLGDKVVGEGTHQRAIIDVQEFKVRAEG